MNNEKKNAVTDSEEITAEYNDSFEAIDASESSKSPKPTNRKDPLTVVLVALVGAVLLTVIIFLITIFTALYPNSTKDTDAQATEQVQISSTEQAVTQTEPQTQTEDETEDKTEAETKAPKKSASNTEQNAFNSYLVTLYPNTYIYSGPGYSYNCVMTLDEQGVYTIVSESYDTATRSIWGKLKSGVGWVNLTYPAQNPTPPAAKEFEPYIVTVYPPTNIYAGPGYNYDCVMTLDEQGAYTIVEEHYNTSTLSTWGKLKSGVGWINLE